MHFNDRTHCICTIITSYDQTFVSAQCSLHEYNFFCSRLLHIFGTLKTYLFQIFWNETFIFVNAFPTFPFLPWFWIFIADASWGCLYFWMFTFYKHFTLILTVWFSCYQLSFAVHKIYSESISSWFIVR